MTPSNDYEFIGTGLNKKEKYWAEKRFNTYLENYHIEDLSDKHLVEELVFLETLHERYKRAYEKSVKTLDASTDPNKSQLIPKGLTDSLNTNMEQILILKGKLGFSDREGLDENRIEKQKKAKFDIWLAQNQTIRECKCPHCSQMILLNMRVDKYDVKKHPFYWDQYFVNIAAWQLLWAKKIEKIDLAKILLGHETTMTDYIDWIEAKLELNPKFQELKKEFLDKIQNEKM